MPRLSVWCIRIGLVYLAVGLTLGALLLFHKGLPWFPWMWRLLPLHIEMLLTGWTVHLILGVAFWILPRFIDPPKRGNERWVWFALLMFNLGIWLAGLGPLVSASAGIVFSGRLTQAAAAIAFTRNAWPRVKPAGT